MQVKDGSWYQRRDKKIVRASFADANEFCCGHVHLDGEIECSMSYKHSGRAFDASDEEDETDLIREVSDPTKPLQLRVGGRYLDGNRIERPIDSRGMDQRFPFRSGGLSYTERGQWSLAVTGENDLICEILDPATEPELVFVPGELYECRNGEKREFVGESHIGGRGKCLVFSCGNGNLSRRHKDGRCEQGLDTQYDIIRPWIDPPTEFVDPRNGKRYQVGPEIK